ncbi:MAG TPA: hypothetical protein VF469_05990 [Kofleriaceae bacterium]
MTIKVIIFINKENLHMSKNLSLVVMMLGLSGIYGCAQDPGASDTKLASIPRSPVTYAHAAAEVGKIEIAQMPEFEASVERMTLDERAELWLTLKGLHDGVHPSEAAENVVMSSPGTILQVEDSGGGSGCSTDRCSHSQSSGGTGWFCCSFGENATWYHDPIKQ